MREQLDLLREQNELIRGLASISAVPAEYFDPVGHTGTPVPERDPIPVPKLPREIALEWLAEHYADQSGRWLQDHVRPEGVQISYKTWQRAIKEFTALENQEGT